MSLGLDPGDRQVLEQKYNGCDPPCLLDSSDGRLLTSWTPHICGMDTYGMKIMPQMSGIATFQDIYGMLIFEDEHAIDV